MVLWPTDVMQPIWKWKEEGAGVECPVQVKMEALPIQNLLLSIVCV